MSLNSQKLMRKYRGESGKINRDAEYVNVAIIVK